MSDPNRHVNHISGEYWECSRCKEALKPVSELIAGSRLGYVEVVSGKEHTCWLAISDDQEIVVLAE